MQYTTETDANISGITAVFYTPINSGSILNTNFEVRIESEKGVEYIDGTSLTTVNATSSTMGEIRLVNYHLDTLYADTVISVILYVKYGTIHERLGSVQWYVLESSTATSSYGTEGHTSVKDTNLS